MQMPKGRCSPVREGTNGDALYKVDMVGRRLWSRFRLTGRDDVVFMVE